MLPPPLPHFSWPSLRCCSVCSSRPAFHTGPSVCGLWLQTTITCIIDHTHCNGSIEDFIQKVIPVFHSSILVHWLLTAKLYGTLQKSWQEWWLRQQFQEQQEIAEVCFDWCDSYWQKSGSWFIWLSGGGIPITSFVLWPVWIGQWDCQ